MTHKTLDYMSSLVNKLTPKEAEARKALLQDMSVAELRREWVILFGNQPYTTRNRSFLIKRLTWRINTLVTGGLSERALKRAAELADETLIRLKPQRLHVEEQEIVEASAPQQAPLPADEMAPGSVIRRLFKGRYHEVTVLGEGRFAYDGEVFDNLTAIAWKICGYRKSGNAFFNLPMKSRA